MPRKTTSRSTRVRDFMLDEARSEYERSSKRRTDWVRYVSKSDFARDYL